MGRRKKTELGEYTKEHLLEDSRDQKIKKIIEQIRLALFSSNEFQQRLMELERLLGQLKETKDSGTEYPELLTRRQVANALGIAERTLGQWAYEKKGIPYIKIGSEVRYRREDVKKFILEGKKIPTN